MFWSHSLKCSVKGIIMVTEEKPASHGWDSGAPLFPLYNHRQFNLKIPLFREQSCCTHLHLSCKLTYILYLLNTQNLPESPNKIVATDKLRCVLQIPTNHEHNVVVVGLQAQRAFLNKRLCIKNQGHHMRQVSFLIIWLQTCPKTHTKHHQCNLFTMCVSQKNQKENHNKQTNLLF